MEEQETAPPRECLMTLDPHPLGRETKAHPPEIKNAGLIIGDAKPIEMGLRPGGPAQSKSMSMATCCSIIPHLPTGPAAPATRVISYTFAENGSSAPVAGGPWHMGFAALLVLCRKRWGLASIHFIRPSARRNSVRSLRTMSEDV